MNETVGDMVKAFLVLIILLAAFYAAALVVASYALHAMRAIGVIVTGRTGIVAAPSAPHR